MRTFLNSVACLLLQATVSYITSFRSNWTDVQLFLQPSSYNIYCFRFNWKRLDCIWKLLIFTDSSEREIMYECDGEEEHLESREELSCTSSFARTKCNYLFSQTLMKTTFRKHESFRSEKKSTNVCWVSLFRESIASKQKEITSRFK